MERDGGRTPVSAIEWVYAHTFKHVHTHVKNTYKPPHGSMMVFAMVLEAGRRHPNGVLE